MGVKIYSVLLAVCLVITAGIAQAGAEVQWFGHAATRIKSVDGKIIVIDPFVTTNPTTPEEHKSLDAFGKVDLILITHGHMDHVGDLPELARRTGAKVVANYEYAVQLGALGIVDPKQVIFMNKGGFVSPLGPNIKIHMVPAEHSSSIDLKGFGMWDENSKTARFLYGGMPVGYVVELEDGFKIYHSGDTHVFGDMRIIHEMHKPDLALVCIGGHFTMDPLGAAHAVREMLKPKIAVPIHYNTYGWIEQNPEEFKRALTGSPVDVQIWKPGTAKTF